MFLATEVLITYLKNACDRGPIPSETVRGYRGGYLPKERREMLASLPPEERLAGLPPEERLAGLSEDQIRRYLDQLHAGRPAPSRKRRKK